MGGRSAAAAIQRSRQRRGKRQVWPRTVRAPAPAAYRKWFAGGNQRVNKAFVRVQNTVTGMQAGQRKVESGELVLADVVAPSVVGTDKSMSLIMNPAEAGFFGRLASVANVYQKYHCVQLQMKYEPVSGTSTPGSFAMCFIPSVTAAVPQNYEEIISIGGNWTTPIWEPKVLSVNTEALGKAFMENYTNVPVDVNKQEQINTVGRLIWSVKDATTASLKCGTLKLQYTFTFSDPKSPEVPNALGGSWGPIDNFPSPLDLMALSETAFETGYDMFVSESDTADVFQLRTRQPLWIMVYGRDHAGAANPVLTVSSGTAASALTAITPSFNMGAGNARWAIYKKPLGHGYLKILSDKTLDDLCIDMCVCPNSFVPVVHY